MSAARIIDRQAWQTPVFSGWVLTIDASDETAAETAAATIGHVCDTTRHPLGYSVLVVCDHDDPEAEWARLVAAEREADAAMQADESDAAMDRWAAAANAMMGHPAHSLSALRYKLDKLFPPDGDGDSTNAWAWRFAGQTVRDIRRLLPGGAE